MSHSQWLVDHNTHLRIVVVAIVASLTLIAIGLHVSGTANLAGTDSDDPGITSAQTLSSFVHPLSVRPTRQLRHAYADHADAI